MRYALITTFEGILFRSSNGVSKVLESTFRMTTSSKARPLTLCQTWKRWQVGHIWVVHIIFQLLHLIVVLPQINWCGPQLSKALVHCNHIKVLKTNRLFFFREHRNRWRAILPAVVQQMWWQDRDEDVLPIHGIQYSTQRVHARCQLKIETDSDNSTSHL